MKHVKIVFLIFWCIPLLIYSQQSSSDAMLRIKGSVKEKNTKNPIKDAEISVLGGKTVTTNVFGDFTIEARVGDEIFISHESFLEVQYTIKDNQSIDILVEDLQEKKDNTSRKYSTSRRYNTSQKEIDLSKSYQSNLQAAKKSLKKDAATSIDYIAKALENIDDQDEYAADKRATLYETLADIYSFWKQPDLAESNFLISLKNKYDIDVKIKLGDARLKIKNYDKALQTYNELIGTRLNSNQKIILYERIGDGHAGLQNNKEAIISYNQALSISKRKKKDDKVILLNSKLAKLLQQEGNIVDAEEYLDNSVQLATRKDKKTAARQRSVAADFYNRNQSFKKEIELRKEALEEIEKIEEEQKAKGQEYEEKEDRTITPQVQNYKIASAFAAQEKYDEAITHLDESIKEAASKNDLIVQKDATRKLGEVYREKGELKKASEAFEEYEVIIDKLYIRKEQEIAQAARFSRKLTTSANRIATLEKDRELNEARYQLAFASQELANQKSSRQQVFIYFLIGITSLLLLAAYLMYKNMRQQRYANNVLALKSLRSQMNPHFIFNALNSVNAFIATSDERNANRYLTDFSVLMRSVLENSEQDFIALEKEIELLKVYVQLEHFRFQDKFEYEILVDPEIKVNEYMIPPMLLQPYVENAVWHGLRYKTEKGKLKIHFNKLDIDSIEIVIADNGIGRKKSKELKTANQKMQKSKGMANIKKRITILNKMYKDKVDVAVSDLNEDEEGTKVVLILKKDTKKH